MKKIFILLFALLPMLLCAETIVTKHNGNIEYVSDVDTTESNLIYYIQDYQTKSIEKSSVVAIIYDDGQYVELYHPADAVDVKDNDVSDQKRKAAWADLQVGQLQTFPDGSQGIVFFVDGKGHGLVVSLRETKAKWDTGKKKHMLDIPEIPNASHAQPFVTEFGEGKQFTAAILRHLPSYLSPAASWCAAQGEDWYLPSATELFFLLRVANEGREDKGAISKAITATGGTKLKGGWYWSSTEANRTEAINISEGGSLAAEEKSEENSVRAIRAF